MSVGSTSGTCLICARKLTPVQLKVHSRRLSSAHISFGARARELSERLEHRRGELYLHLAVEGRMLEDEFASWSLMPPDDEDRVRTINELAAWSRRALDALTEER